MERAKKAFLLALIVGAILSVVEKEWRGNGYDRALRARQDTLLWFETHDDSLIGR